MARRLLPVEERRSPVVAQPGPMSGILSGVDRFGVWIAVLLLYVPVVGHALDVWSSDQEFSFGFLVPPIALALLWSRRVALRGVLSEGSRIGLLALVGGLLMLLVGRRTGFNALAGASFLPTVVGVIAYLYGTSAARILVFPIALQTLSLSLYHGLLAQVGFALQAWTARGATLLANLVGVPVRRSGFDLFVGDQHFVVAQACSGMDALLALLCLGVLVVGLAHATLLRRMLLMALALPIILAANVIRVTLVLVVSRSFGTAVATGPAHPAVDAVLFLCAALLFYLAAALLRCAPRFVVAPSSSR